MKMQLHFLLLLIVIATACVSKTTNNYEVTPTSNQSQIPHEVPDQHSTLSATEIPVIDWVSVSAESEFLHVQIFADGRVKLITQKSQEPKILTSDIEEIENLLNTFERTGEQFDLWNNVPGNSISCTSESCLSYDISVTNMQQKIFSLQLAVDSEDEIPLGISTLAYEMDRFLYYKTE